MGREWSKGKLTEGCNALKQAAVFFFNPEREDSQIQDDFVVSTSNQSASNVTPAIFSPNPSSSNQSNIFFGPSQPINNRILENDNLEDKLDDEIRIFKDTISNNNYIILKEMNAEIKDISNFFKHHGNKFPYLKKLAYLLLCMNSSSSCIERFFSVCGFVNKKNSTNIRYCLFKAKCLLRANFKYLKELNNISY